MKTLPAITFGLLTLLIGTLYCCAKNVPAPQPSPQAAPEITYNGLTAAQHHAAYVYTLRMTAKLP